MTPEEIVKALRCGEDASGTPRPEPSDEEIVCYDLLKLAAADLIERLEKENAALIDVATPGKLCGICKNEFLCADNGCNEILCEECRNYSTCPCSNCLTHPKFEWKGLADT